MDGFRLLSCSLGSCLEMRSGRMKGISLNEPPALRAAKLQILHDAAESHQEIKKPIRSCEGYEGEACI